MPDKQKTPSPAKLVAAEGDGATKTADEIDYAKYTAVLEREREWRRLNPDLWRQVEGYALNETNHKRRFAIKRVLEWIRWHDYADNEGKPVRVSNDYAPIWSRILVLKFPEMKPFIKLRPSVYDDDKLSIGLSEVI